MEQNNSQLPVITEEKALTTINVALTKQQLSIQNLQNEADALEFTEENIPVISSFLAKLNEIDGITEEVHKAGKAPYLEGGRVWDKAKNSNLALTQAIRTPVKDKHNKLCAEVDRKKKESEELRLKNEAIVKGIENNVMSFSTQIANCTTNEQLLAVERVINLEKSESRAAKYGEFHAQAIAKYDEILKPILKDQKEKIQKKEELEKKIKDAEAKNDVVKLDELQEAKEKVEDDIMQNAVKIQEQALTNSPIEVVPMAEEVFADTKSRRSYTIEIADEKEALRFEIKRYFLSHP